MSGEFSPGGAGASGGIDFGYLAQKIGGILDTAETALRSKIDGLGPEPTQKQMLEMQSDLQKWTMLIQLQSTITKELGDALKGIIQKSA